MSGLDRAALLQPLDQTLLSLVHQTESAGSLKKWRIS